MEEYSLIYDFLKKVDTLFPIRLSAKQNLDEYALKLCNKATLCSVRDNDMVVALVAGYTDQVENGLGYISIVAVLPEMQGRGYGSSLVREFLDVAQKKGLRAVHLYAVPDNFPAMRMYRNSYLFCR